MPVTVTNVPPSFGPLLGWKLRAARRAPYSYSAAPCATNPPLLTLTLTAPAPRGGALHTTAVDDSNRPSTSFFEK